MSLHQTAEQTPAAFLIVFVPARPQTCLANFFSAHPILLSYPSGGNHVAQ
jgi:hypothetical protein